MEGGGVQSDATDVEFGPFRLDTKREQLWRDAQPVEIRRKTWQVLQQLIVDPGRLVSRDELLDTVWPDVEVVPAAVTQSIHELRRAFSDDARHPEFNQRYASVGITLAKYKARTHKIPLRLNEWAFEMS